LNKVVKHRLELYQQAFGLISGRAEKNNQKLDFNINWEFNE